MKAIVVERFGGPEVLVPRDLPDPRPGPGEVSIAVTAIDVLWLETALRAERFGPGPMSPDLPWIPGDGVAGRIDAIGEGVDGGRLGERVAAHTGNRGGYAERAVVPASAALPVPEQIGDDVAAALLHDDVTALALWDVTHPRREDAVLVAGASGGLGIALVQLARARADRVVALAHGAKADRVAALGADVVVLDTDDPDWPRTARSALGDHGADVVFDNVGAALGEPAFELLAEGGRMSSHGAPSGRPTEIDEARVVARGATLTGIETVQPSAEEFARLTGRAIEAVVAGDLAPVVGQTWPLAEAADAHRAIESRTVFAKTLLTVD